MNFDKYYQDKMVVESYNQLRSKGLKGRITRILEYRYVDNLVGPETKKDILEIGVGTGFISKLLIKKGNFTGMDISSEMLKKTKKELGNVRLIMGDILNLKIDKTFDKIVTIRVISHFNKEDAVKALKNANGVLKKNGEVIFNLENKSFLRRVLRKITRWGSTYTYQYSKKEVYDIAKKSGFKVEKILCLDHFFIIPLHLINKLLFGKLDKRIVRIESNLRGIPFMCNNFFIKCKKQ